MFDREKRIGKAQKKELVLRRSLGEPMPWLPPGEP
jgi:hypothetical protein